MLTEITEQEFALNIFISNTLSGRETMLRVCELILEKKLHNQITVDVYDDSAMAGIATDSLNGDTLELFDYAVIAHNGTEIIGLGVVGLYSGRMFFQSYVKPEYRKQGITTKFIKQLHNEQHLPEPCYFNWKILHV